MPPHNNNPQEYEREQLWDAVKDVGTEVHEVKTDVGVLSERVSNLAADVEKLVTRHEFGPVKLLVYSLVGSILTGVIAAMLALVIKGH